MGSRFRAAMASAAARAPLIVVTHRVPCITTMSGARAAAEAMAARKRDPIRVWSLQEIHARAKTVA